MSLRCSSSSSPPLQWRSRKQLPGAEPAAWLRDWLFDPSSLTERLRLACEGVLRVQVERQTWQRPRLDECRMLGLRADRKALIREVHLLCDGRPWVFARTVIPQASLRGRQKRLSRLGDRPLGAVLFANPHMRRGPVEVAEIPQSHPLYRTALQQSRARPAVVWGRRSVFRLGGKRLLVSEIFLLPRGRQ